MQRKPNFLIYPGTGIWVIQSCNNIRIIHHMPPAMIKRYLEESGDVLYWCNQGTGLTTVHNVVYRGAKSTCMTKVTPKLLAKYEEEAAPLSAIDRMQGYP